MNASPPYITAFAVLASVLCAPDAEARRRNPVLPIIITPPPGHITIHVEFPNPRAGRPFGGVHTPPPSPIPPTPPKRGNR